MEINKKIGEALNSIKNKKPLVHHITNYVTINDCANITLALGGSPIMAEEKKEVEEMVSIVSALVLNIGELSERIVESMIIAGKKANELNIPVILDPVAVGATKYRSSVIKKFIKEIKFAVIRGNVSEIKAIAGIEGKTRGVDACSEDTLSKEENLIKAKKLAEELSKKLKTVIAITGEVDIISNGDKTYFIENGTELLSKVTGTGCMCTSLIGNYCGANKNYLLGALSGVATMGIAGEIAKENMLKKDAGIGTFKVELMDAIYKFSLKDIENRGNIYEK
ncbi:hydroxyethylthiazole kinase [Clostridium acetireducens DSM 10703]|uniref:Hydroxyethylthiazole kinase n=1 Tax=Clostridium acetireducens DSM 10703 TaxID=1121290 RepID=A0A1E8F0V9_9CLOT|nr:hydroxyethylthiazole kinase [Clostridium acetireducens]OFI06790.1 hydroxyethylthiazole kinase [Clostridium acetireducens DSM 10703]